MGLNRERKPLQELFFPGKFPKGSLILRASVRDVQVKHQSVSDVALMRPGRLRALLRWSHAVQGTGDVIVTSYKHNVD